MTENLHNAREDGNVVHAEAAEVLPCAGEMVNDGDVASTDEAMPSPEGRNEDGMILAGSSAANDPPAAPGDVPVEAVAVAPLPPLEAAGIPLAYDDEPMEPAQNPSVLWDCGGIDGKGIRERYAAHRQRGRVWSSHDRWDFASTLTIRHDHPPQRSPIHAACRTIR